MLLVLDNLEQVVAAAPSSPRSSRPAPTSPWSSPLASSCACAGRSSTRCPRWPPRRRSPSSASARGLSRRRDLGALRPTRQSSTRGRAGRRPHEGTLPCPDPGSALPPSRPAQGRTRRRSPAADAAGDDRVELRAPLRKSSVSSGASPSSPADARSKLPKMSWTPTSTRFSRSLRRASSASQSALLDARDDPRVRGGAARRGRRSE